MGTAIAISFNLKTRVLSLIICGLLIFARNMLSVALFRRTALSTGRNMPKNFARNFSVNARVSDASAFASLAKKLEWKYEEANFDSRVSGFDSTDHHVVANNSDLGNRLASNPVESSTSGYSTGSTTAMVEHLLEKFLSGEKVSKAFVMEVLERSLDQHASVPNIVRLSRARLPDGTLGALNVVGDVHGQFPDFCLLFDEQLGGGLPNSRGNRFVFNGDLVDRGAMGLEIVLSVLLMKLLCGPDAVTVLRGNHETTSMNKVFGFEKEVLRKYDKEVLAQCRRVFEALPVCALLEEQVLVLHGGLGQITQDMTLEEIDALDRRKEPDFKGALSELLWSDPKDGMSGIRFNEGRGGGYIFGADVTARFLRRNNLRLLVRSHEVFMEGYRVLHNGACLSVFSAPNYCGQVGNLASIARFQSQEEGDMSPSILRYKSVVPVPKPRTQPNE